MDRYLFRGKRLDNGEWVQGDLCTMSANGLLIFEGIDVDYMVHYDTIGQCTGVSDKNGKLIFEGDIIKGKYGFPIEYFLGELKDFDNWVVVWNKDKNTIVGFEIINIGCGFETTSYSSDISISDLKKYEIIGNIYDNPELLEVEK